MLLDVNDYNNALAWMLNLVNSIIRKVFCYTGGSDIDVVVNKKK